MRVAALARPARAANALQCPWGRWPACPATREIVAAPTVHAVGTVAARTAERVLPATRRLRPIDTVATLERSVELEMDLRLEAAAMSEMAELMAPSADFRVPKVDWARTSRRVMTSEWIDGIQLIQATPETIQRLVPIGVECFLTQLLELSLFHADPHPGSCTRC